MPVSAPLLTVVGTAAGAVAAVVAYQVGTGGVADAASSTKPAPATSSAAPSPATRTTWLPCEKGTRLRHGVCVRVRTKVVVVEDPAPVVAAAPAVAPVPVARPSRPAPHATRPAPTRHAEPTRAGEDDHAEDPEDATETEPAEDAGHDDGHDDGRDDGPTTGTAAATTTARRTTEPVARDGLGPHAPGDPDPHLPALCQLDDLQLAAATGDRTAGDLQAQPGPGPGTRLRGRSAGPVVGRRGVHRRPRPVDHLEHGVGRVLRGVLGQQPYDERRALRGVREDVVDQRCRARRAGRPRPAATGSRPGRQLDEQRPLLVLGERGPEVHPVRTTTAASQAPAMSCRTGRRASLTIASTLRWRTPTC